MVNHLQKSTRIVLAVVIIVIIAVGTVAVLSYEGILKFPTHNGTGKTDYFTIIEEDEPGALAGMNGSAYKNPGGSPWPVISVHVGDTVVITVMNNKSSVENHGFGIDHYLPAPGITLAAGQSQTISFVANVAGEFRMMCTIQCLIHPLMQNGLLNVTTG